MPTLICVLYFTMTKVGKMNLVLVGAVNIYFVNVGSKVISARNCVTNNVIVINLL